MTHYEITEWGCDTLVGIPGTMRPCPPALRKLADLGIDEIPADALPPNTMEDLRMFGYIEECTP